MRVFGRKTLDYSTEIPVDFDELVFIIGKKELVVSLYRVRTGGRVEIRSNTGPIAVHPRASNLIEVEGISH